MAEHDIRQALAGSEKLPISNDALTLRVLLILSSLDLSQLRIIEARQILDRARIVLYRAQGLTNRLTCASGRWIEASDSQITNTSLIHLVEIS